MTATQPTETALKQRLAALYDALANATMACPGPIPELACTLSKNCYCQGTGEVAMFKGFRQVCSGHRVWRSGIYIKHRCFFVRLQANPCNCSTCICNGLGWQVRAGGMAAGLAGLNRTEAEMWLRGIQPWVHAKTLSEIAGPMPPGPEIDLAALELVCAIKKLEVADAN